VETSEYVRDTRVLTIGEVATTVGLVITSVVTVLVGNSTCELV
jgi:hypothetical protein